MVRTLMAEITMEDSYWGDALLTTIRVLKRVPSKSVEATHYELWFSKRLELSHLESWGLCSFCPYQKFGKLEPRGRKCIFLWYSKHSKGYVFIEQENKGNLDKFKSRDATFVENVFPKKGNIKSKSSLTELNECKSSCTSVSII